MESPFVTAAKTTVLLALAMGFAILCILAVLLLLPELIKRLTGTVFRVTF